MSFYDFNVIYGNKLKRYDVNIIFMSWNTNDAYNISYLLYLKCTLPAPDSLFNYAVKELPCSSDSCLQCPGCKDKWWNLDELVTKCNMSPDEQLFFYKVAFINKRTNDLKEYYNSMPCLLNRDTSWGYPTVGTAKSLSELWNVYFKYSHIIVLGLKILWRLKIH